MIGFELLSNGVIFLQLKFDLRRRYKESILVTKIISFDMRTLLKRLNCAFFLVLIIYSAVREIFVN